MSSPNSRLTHAPAVHAIQGLSYHEWAKTSPGKELMERYKADYTNWVRDAEAAAREHQKLVDAGARLPPFQRTPPPAPPAGANSYVRCVRGRDLSQTAAAGLALAAQPTLRKRSRDEQALLEAALAAELSAGELAALQADLGDALFVNAPSLHGIQGGDDHGRRFNQEAANAQERGAYKPPGATAAERHSWLQQLRPPIVVRVWPRNGRGGRRPAQIVPLGVARFPECGCATPGRMGRGAGCAVCEDALAAV